MKIAVLSTFMFGSSIGGVENHIRFICKELIASGHEIRLFKPVWQHETKTNLQNCDGLTIKYIDCGPQLLGNIRLKVSAFSYFVGFMRKVDYLRVSSKVASKIDQWSPDLIWQHDFSSSWLTTKKLSNRYPIVLTNHTGEFLLLKKLPFFNRLSRFLLSHYKAVIGPSKELTPEHCTCLSVTIHNGVDLKWFKPLEVKARQELRTRILGSDNSKRFVVFCPRRWAPTKGILFLVKAIKKIVESGGLDKYLFVFAGDNYDGYPGYSNDVSILLEKSGAQFVRSGNLDVYKMREWYQAADLIVIPSLMEAVSLAAVEAMSCGTPVLATSVGGMPELIEHGVNGYLVPPKDSDALAESIIAISQDHRRYPIACEALKLVTERYGWRTIATATEKVLLIGAKMPLN